MIRLSAIDRFGALPTPVSSSGTCPTPRPMISPGDWFATSWPPIRTLPPHGRRPLTDLGQLGLAVACDRGDSKDLARADVEVHAVQGRQPAIVVRGHVPDREGDGSRLERGPVECREDGPADHPHGEIRLGRPSGEIPAAVTRPWRITVIRSAIARTSPSLWLMKTMLRPSSVIERSVRNSSSISWGARTDVGSSRIRISRAPVEELEDLDTLLLPDPQLPDAGPRIHAKAHRPGEGGHLLVASGQVQPEPPAIQAEQDVLRDRLRWHQREVLVDPPRSRRRLPPSARQTEPAGRRSGARLRRACTGRRGC